MNDLVSFLDDVEAWRVSRECRRGWDGRHRPQDLGSGVGGAGQGRETASVASEPFTPFERLRDEYPAAVFLEGSRSARVRLISPGDNRGSGSIIGHQLRGVPDGTVVRLEVVE